MCQEIGAASCTPMFQYLGYQHHTCILILTCETLCTNDLNLVQCHETSVITYAQQPINHTQTSGSVLLVSASCILASLSPTACRCLAQCFAVDLDFWLPRRKLWKALSKLHSKYLCLARIKSTVMYVNCPWALFQTAHLLQAAERDRLASTLV